MTKRATSSVMQAERRARWMDTLSQRPDVVDSGIVARIGWDYKYTAQGRRKVHEAQYVVHEHVPATRRHTDGRSWAWALQDHTDKTTKRLHRDGSMQEVIDDSLHAYYISC